jgi:hypothetical protein
MTTADPSVSEPSIDATVDDQTHLDETAPAGTEQALPVDVIFEVLKNERRRRVIDHLKDAEGPVQLGDVAEEIAAMENDKTVAEISYAERKRVYVGLYQCHLPKMDDMGVIDFNQARGLIELTDSASELDPYIDGPPAESRPWYRYYAGVLTLGVVLQGLALVPTVPLSTAMVLPVVLIALGVTSALHAMDELEFESDAEDGLFDQLRGAIAVASERPSSR